jgi:hypothetical protein
MKKEKRKKKEMIFWLFQFQQESSNNQNSQIFIVGSSKVAKIYIYIQRMINNLYFHIWILATFG